MRIASVVEGYGDKEAMPHLIARMGQHFGVEAYSPNPIRAGEWKKIKRVGELERNLTLAHSRDCDKILLVLDLDDGCPVAENDELLPRVEAWKNGRDINVSVVFMVREYESIFLSCADTFTENAALNAKLIAGAEQIRDAKGAMRQLIGRRYKESQDQADLTKRIPIEILIARSRCALKLAKELFDYGLEE